MVTRTQAIKSFLTAKTHKDLADLYNHDMEVQVNVAQGNGEKISQEFNGIRWTEWSDGVENWKSFRIPRNAKSEPEYDKDLELTFDLDKHVDAIGMTGWDWKNRVSKWVAFDFDAMIGHSDKHSKRLNDEELDQIREAVSEIPWVTIRKSTSGSGLHLYVFLDDVPTANHTEHAALARSVLGLMVAMTGVDFNSKVDICGSNMWVWHRKMSSNATGLSVIKKGGVLKDIPKNWRDHVKVVSGHKSRRTPKHIEDLNKPEVERKFLEISGQRSRIKLEDEHMRLLKWLSKSEHSWEWDQDNNMLITHTYALKCAFDELGFIGVYDTMAKGTENGDINCFCFPIRHGAWSIRRYTRGVAECDSWSQDGAGWTSCFYNKQPDLRTAARKAGGIEDPRGGFFFKDAPSANEAALALGVDLAIPIEAQSKKVKLYESKDGRLIGEFERDNNDMFKPGKWLPNKKVFSRIFDARVTPQQDEEASILDDSIRSVITETGEFSYWCMLIDDKWVAQPLQHIRTYLRSIGYKPQDVEKVLGGSIMKPWMLTCRPFEPEYVGDRKWNLNAAKLAFVPSPNTEGLSHPTWDSILDHCGQNLNFYLEDNEWAKSNGIKTGADYLKCWVASLLQYPLEPLPYLFFYSEQQSTGKTTFHEALALLMKNGVQRAETALRSGGDFNAELEGKILCVIEEVNLNERGAKTIYNKIKDMVTSKMLSIHKKNMTPYDVPNTTHWVHCANDAQSVPVFPGDSRIVMIKVNPFKGATIPRRELEPRLIKEAPDFLSTLLNLELPKTTDRLNIPVIETQEKVQAAKSNQSDLDQFITEQCHEAPGESIKYSDFYSAFKEWLGPELQGFWTKRMVGKSLPDGIPYGRNTRDGSQYHVGNLSFSEPETAGDQIYVKLGENLVLKGNT